MKYQFKTILAILVAVFTFGIFSVANAATLSLTPVSSDVGIGEKITINVRIDSEGVGINAAQATIRFPKDILEVVSLDKTSSAFSFWLDEPTFSNTDGVITFTGGTPYGVSGSAVKVLNIEFKAKGNGNGTVSLLETAVTASDGSGTNVLSKTNDAVITVSSQRVVPKVPEPQQIVRTPVASEKLPSKPNLKVSLYPDETSWYNIVGQFTASWDLPLDISGINTVVNKNPSFIPGEQSEGLFNNKTFDALSDGISYLHVRFKNNVGWGPTAHYRLAVDTVSPAGFDLSIIEGNQTDNPTPTLQFKTSDARSGLKEYQVRVGSGDLIKIPVAGFKGSFKLPLQVPGKQKVFVKAVDQADNGIESSVDMEILPIASPAITFVPSQIFSEDEQGVVVKGTALPNINVLLKLQKVANNNQGEVIANGSTKSDEKGNWEFTFGQQPLRNGQYVVIAQSQDDRGALSLAVESSKINVKSKPIIQIGAFQLGMGGAIILLLLLLVGGFGGGVWFYRKRQAKLNMRVDFTESETSKIFNLISDDVKKLSDAFKTPTEGDDEYALGKLQENIKKMGAYIKKGINKIKK
ncbi:MAG: cohesin domain-containing protein [Candidatus Paceibacterota bacterium]